MQHAATLPLIHVLATGGTIAGRGESSTSLTEYAAGAVHAEELVRAVPELGSVARVRVEQVTGIGSSNMTFAVWRRLWERIDAVFATPEATGIVITHGTSTLEETAYFLNLTVRHDRPVVLVGAQRPATALSADGPLNLLNAVRTAACGDSRGRGVLVVLNDQINAARDVTKANTYRLETFRSGELGLLGYVDQDRIAYYRRPEKRHTAASEFDLGATAAFPPVEILYACVEANSALMIDTLVSAGVRGIVFAATGAGTLADRDLEAIRRAGTRPQPPVFVRSSRVGNGRVIERDAYAGLGIVPADNLSPQKARILLMLALAGTRDPAELRRIFAEY